MDWVVGLAALCSAATLITFVVNMSKSTKARGMQEATQAAAIGRLEEKVEDLEDKLKDYPEFKAEMKATMSSILSEIKLLRKV